MSAMQLRPLGFGEILDGAFTLYRRHFLTLFATALIPLIPISLASGMYVHVSATLDPATAAVEGFVWTMVFFLVTGVLSVLAFAALTREAAQAIAGDEVSLADAYRHGLRSFLPLLGAAILAYGAFFAVMFGLAIVGGIAAAILIPSGNAVVAGLAGAVVVIGVVILMLGLMAMLFAVIPAVVVEGKGPWSALQRSRQLSKGGRMRILGVLLVSWLIVMLPFMAVMFAAGMGMAIFDPAATASLSVGELFFQQILSFLSGSLTFPFFVACMVLLYYDRRVRTEAYDLEVATEGLVPAT